jgi:hypothetical protein
MKTALTLFFLTSCVCLYAQLPSTDLHLFEFTETDGKINLESAYYLNDFNQQGYNNQPAFLKPNKLLISSNAFGDPSKTEILELDIEQLLVNRITNTEESEFSPTVLDQSSFSTVRIEEDELTQSLYIYNYPSGTEKEHLFPTIPNIGYHYWIDDYTLALFMVDDINYLALGFRSDGTTKILESNIGRCIKKYFSSTFLFVSKTSADRWYLKSFNPDNGRTKTLIQMPTGSEDFEVAKDGTIYCTQGSKIYSCNLIVNKEFTEAIDLRNYNIDNISRIAIMDNQMAIVSQK